MFIINKIHEISQEKIKEKSLEWFNTEFDEIGLDIKVRRPIDQQKESEFIKISIPSNIEDEISKLSKGTYVLCNIIFKGLKVSNDYINEEWEISDFITQEKYDEEQKSELIDNNIELDNIQSLLDIIEENNSKENQENQENILFSNENINEEIKEIKENNEEISLVNEIKVKKNIKKNKNISEKIIENKFIKNNKKKELITKLSKKIVFN